MKNGLNSLAVLICLAIAILPGVCFGVTAAELQNLLKEGETVAIVDIRGRGDFIAGHIPNAINIPAAVIKYKQLPPLGRVIVCGDGIDTADATAAASVLNQKSGIDAEILDGGYPSWAELKYPNTRKVGIARQMFRYITYEKLRRAAGADHGMVLVDMRRVRGRQKGPEPAETLLLSDLNEILPGFETITLAPRRLNSKGPTEAVPTAKFFRAMRKEKGRVFVLIDRGDGRAEKVARHLHGAGITQVIILAGGEMALQKRGETGVETHIVQD